MDARCVNEDDLRVVASEDAKQPVARGLRLFAYYGDLLAKVSVHQRALAYVGSPHYRHKAGAVTGREPGFLYKYPI